MKNDKELAAAVRAFLNRSDPKDAHGLGQLAYENLAIALAKHDGSIGDDSNA